MAALRSGCLERAAGLRQPQNSEHDDIVADIFVIDRSAPFQHNHLHYFQHNHLHRSSAVVIILQNSARISEPAFG